MSKLFDQRVLELQNKVLRLHVILFGVALATPTLILSEQPPATQADSALKSVNIPIKGMLCSACAARVTKTLSGIGGVESVQVNQPKGSAHVIYEATKVSPEEMRAAINKLGFEAGVPRGEN